MDWLDRFWIGTGWVMLAASAGAAWWALGSDWFRGWRERRRGLTMPRRRCRRCEYDMRGVPGLVCPECGREARGERSLLGWRVRRWGVAFGVVSLAASYTARCGPEVRVHGWWALAPTVVLVLWADPPEVGGAFRRIPSSELERRRDTEVLSQVSRRLLAWRIQRRWRAAAPKDCDVVIIPVGHLVRDRLVTTDTPRGKVLSVDRRADQLAREVGRMVSSSGGMRLVPWLEGVTDRLVVQANPDELDRVRELLRMLEEVGSAGGVLDGEHFLVVDPRVAPWLDDGARGDHFLGTMIERRAVPVGDEPDDRARLAGGYAAGRWIFVGKPEVRARSVEFVRLIASCTAERPTLEAPWVTAWNLRGLDGPSDTPGLAASAVCDLAREVCPEWRPSMAQRIEVLAAGPVLLAHGEEPERRRVAELVEGIRAVARGGGDRRLGPYAAAPGPAEEAVPQHVAVLAGLGSVVARVGGPYWKELGRRAPWWTPRARPVNWTPYEAPADLSLRRVGTLAVVRSSDPRLLEAAVALLREWEFRPVDPAELEPSAHDDGVDEMFVEPRER